MTEMLLTGAPVVSDDELSTTLGEVFTIYFGIARSIVRMERRPAVYYSSFQLEEVDVRLNDGTRFELMFKNLSRQLEIARRVKPAFLYDPQREIDAYGTILIPERLGTPICYGAFVNRREGQYWLFIERIVGTRLRELGEFETWELAARWLAALHFEYAPAAERLVNGTHLLKCDREYFEVWIERALQVCACDATSARQIEWLAARYDPVVEHLTALPATFIHGEFYPSNVMVRETLSGTSVCPVDWEMAAHGPGLLDLAALMSGGWSETKAMSLARAYYDAARVACEDLPPFDAFLTSLDYCRLHLAVQWLGWSAGWSPPPEHKHDWLTAALMLAEKLNL